MKNRLFLLVLVCVFAITGCGLKEGNKKYECEYTKKDSGRQIISKRVIEVNAKGEPVVYVHTYGYSNYGDNKDAYNKACDNLKAAVKDEKIKEHKDVLTVDVTCNEKNNYQVFIVAKYDAIKLKKEEDFKDINEYIAKYMKKDGTFDKDSWKDLYYKERNEGKYTCNF